MLTAAMILLWLVLFVLFWPLAIAALIVVPVLWVLSIPVRLAVWVVEGALRLVKGVLFLPARLLGGGANG